MKQDNARFWVWHRKGWVKLTLRPGQSLTVCERSRTDEGYNCEASTLTHHGETVVCEWYETGQDCDGRYERGGEVFCDLVDLAPATCSPSYPSSENVGIKAPVWKLATAYQRDHAAESAGY